MEKAPTELVRFLADKMTNVNCDYKKMFGYPAYFINGNMFAGIHSDELFIRLSEADIKKNCKDVTSFEPMPGRPMKGYIVLPKTVYSDNKLFSELIDKSITYAFSLPARGKKLK